MIPKLLVEQRDSAWNQQQWQNITFPQSSKAQLFVEWSIVPIPLDSMLSSCLKS